MLKITNGVEIFEVTEGAYNGIYKDMGFVKFEDKQVSVEEDKEPEDKLSKEEKRCIELEEKPISSWTKNEIKDYAKLKEISLEGTTNAEEARDRIKEYLNDSEE